MNQDNCSSRCRSSLLVLLLSWLKLMIRYILNSGFLLIWDLDNVSMDPAKVLSELVATLA